MNRPLSVKFFAMLVKPFTSGVLSGFLAFLLRRQHSGVASAGTRTIRVVAYNIEDDTVATRRPAPA